MQEAEATTTLLTREARLIEGLRVLVEQYVDDHASPQSEDALASLARRLRERIRLEEQSLFPAIERLVGDPQFPQTQRMRRQHAVLLDLVRGIERALQEGKFTVAAGDLRELKAALHAHLEEERRVLLPILAAEGRGCA